MTFRVNQKVECVDALASHGYQWLGDVPSEGAIYTVAGFGEHQGILGLLLVEIKNIPFDGCYRASRFHPIVEPKTEISFTTGADPSSGQFDNRRKVRKKVTI